MKKIYILTFVVLFALQHGAFAKDKDAYTPPVVPDVSKVSKDVKDEDKNCKDISPTGKSNCGDKGGNGHDDNGKGNGGNDNGKGNGKDNDGKDNGKGKDK